MQRLPRIPLHSAKVTKGNFRQMHMGSASGFARIKCKCFRGL